MYGGAANLQDESPVTIYPNDSADTGGMHEAVRTVILHNYGPGTAWISGDSGLGTDAKYYSIGIDPGEKLTIRTSQKFYAYGDTDDSDVSLHSGAGKTRLGYLSI